MSDEELIGRQIAVEVAKAQVAKADADLALLAAGAWQAVGAGAAADLAAVEAWSRAQR